MQNHRARRVRVLALVLTSALIGVASFGVAETASKRTDTGGIGTSSEQQTFESAHLGGEIVRLPGVFDPIEAEIRMLPLMKTERALFAGKRVLEIGTGSGIISVYAAMLGATKVVATDINANAIRSAELNAARFDVGAIVEPRLVSESDVSAYAVIRPDEAFDVIISNPPYALDLEAPKNNAVTDTGDLGFSIVKGLHTHLAPGGVAILFYDSLFYHLTMVEFARHKGFQVRSHRPLRLIGWEAEALFNSYLRRLLESRGEDPTAFRFDHSKRGGVQGIGVLEFFRRYPQTLFPGRPKKPYPGMITVRHAARPKVARD